MSADRMVHAKLGDGGEIVRYNRAGKWALEYPVGHMIPMRHLSVGQAVVLAAEGLKDGGQVFRSRYGGRAFDSRLKRYEAQEGER